MPGTNEIIGQAVRAKLNPQTGGPLPARWNVYHRHDETFLTGDRYPAVYVVVRESIILEEETDNRCLVGYPVSIVMMDREAAGKRTDPNLTSDRRTAQQAVHTTNYPGLSVEDIRIDEEPGVDLETIADDGVAAVGFALMIGLIEQRCPAEAVP